MKIKSKAQFDSESEKFKDHSYKVNLLLTGVTGSVGSHILFELLRDFANHKYLGKIIVLSRSNSITGHSAFERVAYQIRSKNAPEYLNSFDSDLLFSFIEVVECDLNDVFLGDKLSKYNNLKNLHVIHSAATTNLAITPEAYDTNYKTNYRGSLGLLNACKSFVTKFTFVSTAYSCGIQEGLIPHDYRMLDKNDFRNHYEKIKAKLEHELEETCESLDIHFQVLRPAVVCGRLLDAPLYRIANFNVFYSCGKFLFSVNKRNKDHRIKIETFKETGLHITPVDYVAKIIVAAFTRNDIKFLNIAPKKGYMLKEMIPKLANSMGYDNIELVKALDKNDASNGTQALFYRMVDSTFGKYMKSPSYEFDVNDLQNLLPDVTIPKAEDHMENLLAFAMQNNFKTMETLEIDHIN